MKKKYSRFICALLALALAVLCCACDSNTTDGSKQTEPKAGEKTATKIELVKLPEKSEYIVGEPFSADGGMLSVTYGDGSVEEIPLTDSAVELSKVNTERAGKKTVNVRFLGEKTSFSVNVRNEGFQVSFDLNYDGAEDIPPVDVEKKAQVAMPDTPVREGYMFYQWYTDENCTVAYDFSAEVNGNMTLYAAWQENGAEYYTVNYSLNYYGVLPDGYIQQVKSGELSRGPAVEMVRDGFDFMGWYSDPACSVPFDSEMVPITADTTIYAKWEQTAPASVYTFEAEYTDLTNKVGPGASGSASEAGMIVPMQQLDASNGSAVSYLYQKGLSLEFWIASSKEVTDAKLTVRVASELGDISLSNENYIIFVNGESMKYAADIIGGEGFQDLIVIENVHLTEGANLIQLVTNNSVNPLGEGMGTFQGTAPMVDCIRLATSSVLMWDQNYGLPAKNRA